MDRRMKKRIFDIIQIGQDSDLPSRAFDIGISVVIILNITATFLSTFDNMEALNWLWIDIEAVTLALFVVEYLLRLVTAEYLYPNDSPIRAMIRFAFSFDGIIELLTILPFYMLTGFVAFRMLRVVRIFHLFRINAYYDSFQIITAVLYEKRNQILSSVFIILILMMASSLCIYSVEHDAQPDAFQNAFSGLYWSMSTLLTVGYGDIAPVTTLGRIITMFMELLGVGLVAIPTGIISAGFVEHYEKVQEDTDEIADGDKSLFLSGKGSTSGGIRLQTVIIDIDSRWLGKTAKEMLEEDHVVLVMVQRGSDKLMPTEQYRVQVGDALVVHVYDRK